MTEALGGVPLKDFVAETLRQIILGVAEAQVFAETQGAVVNPVRGLHATPSGETQYFIEGLGARNFARRVVFDIAVTAQSDVKNQGGFGIFAGAVGIGTQANITSVDNVTSRIRFDVLVLLPEQQQESA